MQSHDQSGAKTSDGRPMTGPDRPLPKFSPEEIARIGREAKLSLDADREFRKKTKRKSRRSQAPPSDQSH
jgi:hypothetical protein